MHIQSYHTVSALCLVNEGFFPHVRLFTFHLVSCQAITRYSGANDAGLLLREVW